MKTVPGNEGYRRAPGGERGNAENGNGNYTGIGMLDGWLVVMSYYVGASAARQVPNLGDAFRLMTQTRGTGSARSAKLPIRRGAEQ